MNDPPVKHAMVPAASSCGVIVQNKRSTHRPGGCVGILFQLFDWNRKFAVKKLFPKKFLHAVRAPRSVSKKCSGDEKMPVAKFLLIADENRGGFPSTKKLSEVGAFTRSSHDSAPDNAICAPSLVARLMGLESMPSLPQDKPRKAVDSAFCYDGSETSGSSRHDLDLEMGGRCKLETQPQKLQKIGAFNREPVSRRLGSEAFLFNKSVLSRTRKQHHKLASPVKSPRLLSRKSSARLVEAAVKILEPGLQQTNRSRCCLTYTDFSQNNIKEIDVLPSSLKNSQPLASRDGPPCKTCSTSVEAADVKLKCEEPYVVEYKYSAAGTGGTSSSSTNDEVELNKFKPPPCLKDGRKLSPAAPTKLNIQIRSGEHFNRKSLPLGNDQNQRKANEESSSRTISKQNNLRKNKMQLARDRIATGSGVHSCQQRKDLRASKPSGNSLLNKNICRHVCTGTTSLALSSVQVEKGRNTLLRKTSSHKRRSNNSSLTTDVSINKGISCSKHMSIKNEKIPVKGRNARSTIMSSQESNLRKQVDDNGGTCTKNKGVVSFTFNASSKHDSSSASSVEDLGSQICHANAMHFSTSHAEKSAINSVGDNLLSRRVGAFTVDELSALLEQKIKELNVSQSGIEVGDEVGRSTADILEELISALTKGLPLTQENVDNCRDNFSQMEDQSEKSSDSSSVIDSQGCKSNKLEGACGTSTSSYCDQPSPVSILEVSFSNESSLSESLSCNSASGSKSYFSFTEGSCTKSSDPDTDVSDSASFSDIRTERTISWISLENISIMYNSFRGDNRLLQSNPSFIREVISNTELLFGSVSSHDLEDELGFSIGSLILDTLENLLHSLWNSTCNTVFPDAKDNGQLRRFLFDYMVEYLDKRYRCYCKSGYKLWEKLPSFLNSGKLSGEIYADIRKCDDLGGNILDDIIEKEMSHLSGEWDDFGLEAFDEGTRIEHHILQTLVDETMMDLFSW